MRRALLLGLATLVACDDALDQRLAIIDGPRVLAIQSAPAEAKPGAAVTYRALISAPEGPVPDAPTWAFCLAPKPPTEDNAVSTACLGDDSLMELGATTEVMGMLPMDGCSLFGPNVPPGGFRPRDADATGGYYQPVRVDVVDEVAFGFSRITCPLPNTTSDIARKYMLEYVANENPTLDPITLASVPADADVSLTASWPAESVESFLYYDPLAQKLVTRREAMRVSWFATGGSLAVDASAVGEDVTATNVSTIWHTPATGDAWLWFVLRDSRGGIAWQQLHVQVE